MIQFDEVLNHYPQRVRGFKENILKEYLQYRILDILYRSNYADRLVFIGGTAIRIVYDGMRFSEDLDFDNLGLTEEDFQNAADIIRRELERDGYEITVKNVFKGAYHCYIRFPGILFEHGLSGHKQARILIQIDAQPQNYAYEPRKFLLNAFGVFRYINTVEPGLLLSQKIAACLDRKREKGRDFFDVVYLWSLAQPDYGYLDQRYGIATQTQLVGALGQCAASLNMEALARDVEPFLFDPSQADRVRLFERWLAEL